MEVGSISSIPRTVEEIFKDFSSRRAGIVRALTHDVDDFYAQCDPDKENLCLYGHPNGSWEVNLPAEEVPPELPEPALGINFARDGMNRKDWLSLVAVHSDSWLLSVAFYLGAPLNRNDRGRCFELVIRKDCRVSGTGRIDTWSARPGVPQALLWKRLFSMINEHPTVFEVVLNRRQSKEKSGIDSGSKSKPSTKRSSEGEIRSNTKMIDDAYGEDDDEHSETLCGTCGGNYSADEFWIGCDICERWFHGKCVKITPAKAESIKQYKCPSCSSKKVRQ